MWPLLGRWVNLFVWGILMRPSSNIFFLNEDRAYIRSFSINNFCLVLSVVEVINYFLVWLSTAEHTQIKMAKNGTTISSELIAMLPEVWLLKIPWTLKPRMNNLPKLKIQWVTSIIHSMRYRLMQRNAKLYYHFPQWTNWFA